MKMRNLLLAAPLLVMGVAASGQTTTTGNDNDNDNAGQNQPGDFGQNWPEGMGMTFFSDDTMQTLRADEELRAAWQSMSEVDREMLRGDCARMGGSTAAGATASDTSSTATAKNSTNSSASDTAATTQSGDAAASESSTGSDNGSSSDTEGSATARASITSENMGRLCTLFELN